MDDYEMKQPKHPFDLNRPIAMPFVHIFQNKVRPVLDEVPNHQAQLLFFEVVDRPPDLPEELKEIDHLMMGFSLIYLN